MLTARLIHFQEAPMIPHFSRTSFRSALVMLLLPLLIATPGFAQKAITRDLTPEQKDLAAISVPASDLKVKAWVDRADETYKIGDTLQLYVKPNQDAYITVIDVGTSGRAIILFPNQFQRDNHVLAHQVLQIPGPDASWRIKVGGVPGQETVKIIATSSPAPVIDPKQLADLGAVYAYRGVTPSLTKDLNIELNERRSDSRAEYVQYLSIIADTGGVAPQTYHQPVAPQPMVPPRPVSKPSTAVSPEDLYRLGEASFYGDGGRADHRAALKYFTSAADAGHVGAMYFAGRIHEAGRDVDPSVPQAMSWYKRGADLGNTQAMVRLAILHAKPDGANRDIAETHRWLKKAASQGDGMAMLHMAKLLDGGLGTERSPKDAARYLLSALKTGAWTVVDQVAKFNEDTRREVQGQLREAGFYKGATEGVVGSETRAAMVEFARAG
jgi:hypothetical protein